MKGKFAQSKSSIVTCKTGGQPLSVMKVTSHRKSSADASASPKRKRSQNMETYREAIARSSKESTLNQQTHELNTLSHPVHQEVFKATGLESTEHIDKNEALAMKVVVGLTYCQEREMRWVFKDSGVKIANEGAEREVAEELTRDDVTQ